VLTHATAGVSFIALMFSHSDLIRAFGQAGFIAVMVAMVAVLVLVPLLGILLVRHETAFADSVRGMDRALDVLRRVCRWIAVRMVSHPGFYSLIGLGLVVVLSIATPNSIRATGWPIRCRTGTGGTGEPTSGRQAHRGQSNRRADRIPERKIALRSRNARLIADVHSAVQQQAGVGNVLVAGNAAPLARGKGQQAGHRNAEVRAGAEHRECSSPMRERCG